MLQIKNKQKEEKKIRGTHCVDIRKNSFVPTIPVKPTPVPPCPRRTERKSAQPTSSPGNTQSTSTSAFMACMQFPLGTLFPRLIFSTTRRSYKKRAPRAIKEIRKFAQKHMGTSDVRLDVKLNQFLWSKGIRNVPFRVRVRLARKMNEDDEAKEKMYTLVTWVPVSEFKGLQTKVVEE